MVSWHEYGDRSGYPVAYFHGTPGSGIEARALSAAATRLGVRLIAPDRPGMGNSRRRPSHSLVTWPSTFAALLDAAEVERAGILAWSGGGPFAITCLAHASERVSSIALLAPAGLRDEWPRSQRSITRLALHASSPFSKLPALPTLAASAIFRARTLVKPGIPARTWVSPSHAAFAQGASGPVHDDALITSNWTHDLQRAAAVINSGRASATLWHGERDTVVPLDYSRALAPALGARLIEVPGIGHRGIFLRYGADALEYLAPL